MIRILSIRVGTTPFFMVIYNLFLADIKADNFFIDWKAHGDDSILIERVQLGDLEDAAYIPPGSAMIGKQAGNSMWRSPEAHAKGPVNKPSDIFSFALVVSLYSSHFSSISGLIFLLCSVSTLCINASSLPWGKRSWRTAA